MASKGEEGSTAVVLDTDGDVGVADWGGYVCGGRGVYRDGFVGRGVIGGAGSDAEEVFVRHWCKVTEYKY